MNYGDFEVAVVNPREPMAKKKRKTPPRAKNGRFKKGGSSSGGSRKKPARTENPRRPRRKGGGGRRRRRRNPRGEQVAIRSQGAWPLKSGNLDLVAPMVLNKLLVALVVKKWGSGDGKGLLGPGASSDFVGSSWTFRDYGLGFLATYAGAKIVAARMGRQWGEAFWLTGVADMAARLVWTEGIARSPKLRDWFGQYEDPNMAVLREMNGFGAYQPGAIIESPSGRFMLDSNNQWQAMQGDLVPANPQYDGMLVPANPQYDGNVVAARPGFDGRFGHAINTPSQQARYQRTGSEDPYSTVWQQVG